jgi:hypothetical protein
MPAADLSAVTKTLTRLLRTNITRLAGPAAPPVTVVAGPPEEQSTASRTVNLHMYHVAEDQFRKNLPGPGLDLNNVATTPMALSLFYVLTVHHIANAAHIAETEQQLMGYALKTMHDFPVIEDDTTVQSLPNAPPILVFDPGLQGGGNHLEIILRPLTPEDALTFWSTGLEQTARLSAYYEVRVVLLEPEPWRVAPGIVLTLGQYVTQVGGVHLESASSDLKFTPPGAGAQVIISDPARPALDNPPGNPAFPDNYRFVIRGTNLASGIDRCLVIRSPGWRNITPPVEEIAMGQGTAGAGRWGVGFFSDRIEVETTNQLSYPDGAGGTATLNLTPGLFLASVETVTGETATGTGTRRLSQRSNEIVFFLTPRILSHTPPVVIPGNPALPPPGNQPRLRITINLSPRFALNQGGAVTAQQLPIFLSVHGAVYERVNAFAAVPSDNDGRFTVAAASLTFQPLFDATVPGAYPVRLVVDGAEAQPFWIEI